jgi:methylmalonyl-CoA mutase
LAADYIPPKIELARASQEEKNYQLTQVTEFQKTHSTQAQLEIKNLKRAALSGENIFEALLSAARHCSLYQMSQALYEVGGQYRRNL